MLLLWAARWHGVQMLAQGPATNLILNMPGHSKPRCWRVEATTGPYRIARPGHTFSQGRQARMAFPVLLGHIAGWRLYTVQEGLQDGVPAEEALERIGEGVC